MSINLSALMKQRYDTAANWTAQNPTLLAGEIGIESDTKKWKVGTGSTAWTSLTYAIGGTYPIVNADIAAAAAIAYSKLATLTSGNIVLGSAANVATSTAVTGDVTISNTGVTAIAAGVIVNADVNASAAIVDTKLATIATAGKVSNSATTATSANTASAIVARDASGNFTAGTITAALTGAASSNVLKAGDTMTGDLVVPSLNGGQLAGTRNRIINGAVAVDQRNCGAAKTFTAAAALAYSVDRWYGYCTGANVTGQQVAGATAGEYRYRFTGAASVTAIGFGHRIEQLNSTDLASSTATLSVDLANSLLTTVTWTAYYATTANTFGTLASPTRTQIATGTFTVTSTVTRYNTNISVPAAATTGIEIVFTVGAQTSGTWTIGNVQLEPGTVATPFERRSFGAELALCQRYFEKSFNLGIAPVTNAGASTGEVFCSCGITLGNSYVNEVYFKVSKRTAPTATLFNRLNASNDWQFYNSAGTLTNSGSVETATENSFRVVLIANVTSTIAIGHFTASAEL